MRGQGLNASPECVLSTGINPMKRVPESPLIDTGRGQIHDLVQADERALMKLQLLNQFHAQVPHLPMFANSANDGFVFSNFSRH